MSYRSITGAFVLNRPLSVNQAEYLKAFYDIKHRARNTNVRYLEEIEHTQIRTAPDVNLPVGLEGEFLITKTSDYLLPGGRHPYSMPEMWCPWLIHSDKQRLIWDNDTRTPHYIEWVEYFIEKFFLRWGYTLNGYVDVNKEDFTKVRVTAKANHLITAKLDG